MIKKKILSLSLSVIMLAGLFCTDFNSHVANAEDTQDPMIIVSLGDSYSSGEGIEPFYGHGWFNFDEKIKNEDWLCHRSEKSWPGKIKINGEYLKDHRKKVADDDPIQWYFTAISGAKTQHISDEQFVKKVHKLNFGWEEFSLTVKRDVPIPVETDIITQNNLTGKVDYVTMTIGGNDVDFAKVINQGVKNVPVLNPDGLDNVLAKVEGNMTKTLNKLKNTYEDIEEKAGSDAAIIIAGYPRLIDPQGSYTYAIGRKDAKRINDDTEYFNSCIQKRVEECQAEGMNIHFVSVWDEFKGHEAFTLFHYINGIRLSTLEDIDDINPISAYSIHPNEAGAKVYAKKVQEKIEELESNKRTGAIRGIVIDEETRQPIENAGVVITSSDNKARRVWSDSEGKFSLKLPAGQYSVEVGAEDYEIRLWDNITVEENEDMPLPYYPLIKGSTNEQGIAEGIITDAVTGLPLERAKIEITPGWNSRHIKEEIDKSPIYTDLNGHYSVKLNLGTYCLTIKKDGYITDTLNIVVARGTRSNQNTAVTPFIEDTDDFRIVLTWGENPRDLDSHLVGSRSDGTQYHVYYWDKVAYENSESCCELDVDDTTSYGPETITLKASGDKPFYYYVHRYAGSGHISTSEAKVKVYKGDHVIKIFNVPKDKGDNDIWNVFAIVNGQIITKNTMTDEPSLAYAGEDYGERDFINTSLMARQGKTRDLDEELKLFIEAEDVMSETEEDELIVEEDEDIPTEEETENSEDTTETDSNKDEAESEIDDATEEISEE